MSISNLEPGQLNHIALPSADPERGARFYCQVLGFRLVPRPAFSFDGRWLYRAEAGVMIHLIHNEHDSVQDSVPANENSRSSSADPINTRGHHFAMQSSNIARDLQLLAEHGVETVARTLPDRGYRQVFFRDPDGNVIEIGEWPLVAEMVVN
jgi:catechol 2,3-dioxygenase-like lactoylglutathione lyase family enzyme